MKPNTSEDSTSHATLIDATYSFVVAMQQHTFAKVLDEVPTECKLQSPDPCNRRRRPCIVLVPVFSRVEGNRSQQGCVRLQDVQWCLCSMEQFVNRGAMNSMYLLL